MASPAKLPRRLEPALTAQTMERYDACPAAFVRDLEVARFLAQHKLPPSTPDEDNPKLVHERAKKLREIISDVPLHSARFRLGKRVNVARFVQREASSRGIELDAGDIAFCVTTIRKRDALVEELIAKAGGKGVKLEWDLETRTLREVLGSQNVPVEGVVNGAVTAVSARGRHVLLFDFTTGYAPHRSNRTNRQFTTLAALAALELERAGAALSRTTVQVAVLNRNDVPADKAESLRYGPQQLSAAVNWLKAVAEDRGNLKTRYVRSSDAEGTPTPRFAAALDRAAVMGDQCKHCAGAICCGKLRVSMETMTREMAENHTHRLTEQRAMVKQTAESLALATEPTNELPMNADTLASILETSNTLRLAQELPKKVWEEASDLFRQLQERKISVPRWTLKEGARRLNFRDQLPTLSASGKPVVDEKQGDLIHDADTSPHALFEALGPVLGDMSFREFVRRTCKAEPSSVEAVIADITGVPPKQVFEKVLVPQLGPRNPCEMRPNKPSVVPAATTEANTGALPEAKKTSARAKA